MTQRARRTPSDLTNAASTVASSPFQKSCTRSSSISSSPALVTYQTTLNRFGIYIYIYISDLELGDRVWGRAVSDGIGRSRELQRTRVKSVAVYKTLSIVTTWEKTLETRPRGSQQRETRMDTLVALEAAHLSPPQRDTRHLSIHTGCFWG